MNQFKGLTIIVLILAGFLAAGPAILWAGTDVATEMAEEAKDTGSSGELESVVPDVEEEQMIEDSQHGS